MITRLHDITRLTGWETALAVSVGCETSWVAAAAQGRGPPYKRADKEVKISDIYFKGRRVDDDFHVLDPEQRKLRLNINESADRVRVALGVMSIDADFEREEGDL